MVLFASTLQVNTNGIISFTNPISAYTPDSFPLGNSQELIAPYWGDVDTTGTGIIWYRETTDPDLLERADNEIRQAFPTLIRYASEFLFIATWDHVGYYNSNTDRVCVTMQLDVYVYITVDVATCHLKR